VPCAAEIRLRDIATPGQAGESLQLVEAYARRADKRRGGFEWAKPFGRLTAGIYTKAPDDRLRSVEAARPAATPYRSGTDQGIRNPTFVFVGGSGLWRRP